MSSQRWHLTLKHIDGPMGVCGCNLNNVLIMVKLGWETRTKIIDGLCKTYFWIKGEIKKEKATGSMLIYGSIDLSSSTSYRTYVHSKGPIALDSSYQDH
jgi:GDP-D-mannose 3',5'-epimerase